MCKPKDEMNRFLTGVSDLVKEECRTKMLYNDMNISIIMVYAQYIEESKVKRLGRDLKRGMFEDQVQTRIQKRAQNQDVTSVPKVD